MPSAEDTEITLGTGKLLFLFFGLVGVCALFFALGYSLGKKSEPTIAVASAAIPQPATPSTNKTGGTSAPPMTFYKSVEQKDATPELTPATDSKAETPATTANPTEPPTQPTSAAESMTSLPTSGYLVQVAAVTKQEDAEALVDALKKKQYPAFVAPQSTTDKLFHVQVGPYPELKDAEGMRARLIGDGYSPILKK
jgi:DedD protein